MIFCFKNSSFEKNIIKRVITFNQSSYITFQQILLCQNKIILYLFKKYNEVIVLFLLTCTTKIWYSFKSGLNRNDYDLEQESIHERVL